MRAVLIVRIACISLLGMLSACQTAALDEAAIAREAALATQRGCKPIRWFREHTIPVRALAEGSGDFCLVHDLMQRNLLDPHDNSNPGSPDRTGAIRFFRATKATVDLRGHLVTGKPFHNTYGVVAYDDADLAVKNGRIATPGTNAVGVYMGHDLGRSCASNTPGCKSTFEDLPRQRTVGLLPGGRRHEVDWKDLPETRFTLDALHIQSGGRAVLMSGAGNTIRNSTLEVDGHTAVYLYGAKQLIENNTFIVRLKPGHEGHLPAMLKLRDAHGSVIRNNRFIVKGLFAGQAEAAINLLESTDVLIEGNTVEGAKTLVRKDAASTTVEQGNSLK